jgi:hypothetical protein
MQGNGIEDRDCPLQRVVSAASNVPRLIRPKWKSTKQAEKVLVTVNAIEMRRSKGEKKMSNRMHQCFSSVFMYLDQEI